MNLCAVNATVCVFQALVDMKMLQEIKEYVKKGNIS
jgi:hypothetical protein